jgi:hypothetical protein
LKYVVFPDQKALQDLQEIQVPQEAVYSKESVDPGG